MCDNVVIQQAVCSSVLGHRGLDLGLQAVLITCWAVVGAVLCRGERRFQTFVTHRRKVYPPTLEDVEPVWKIDSQGSKHANMQVLSIGQRFSKRVLDPAGWVRG